MKPKRIERLFYSLAELAASHGMEFSLDDYLSKSKAEALNGFLTDNKSRTSSLTLRCWWPESSDQSGDAAEMVDEGETEAGDGDD
ncbi:MAG: hypothetical protein J6T26_00795 [Firmicutes bacterium]|nr:hypothetical protein [Bacillota bacterium]